jgi:hypothetical protein
VQTVSAIQGEYLFMERSPEQNGVLATCEELGIGFVPWGRVGMGYLTGKITAQARFDAKNDLHSNFDRFTPDAIAANKPIVDFRQQFAATKNAAPAQIALAWLLVKKPFIVPIPGKRNPIPAPSPVEAPRAGHPEFEGWLWALVQVNPAMLDSALERVNISLPRRVLHRLDARARSAGETRSGFIARMAIEGRESVAHT